MLESEKNTNVTVLETGSDGSERDEQTPQPPRRTTSNGSSRGLLNTDDWWAWELVGVFFSAGAIIAIVALLYHVNYGPQPNWGWEFPGKHVGHEYIKPKRIEVSLNSVISWISTVGKICVLIPVTKGLGQLKWVWFAEQERELTDFEKFENATRGLTGSAFLLWRLKGRHFAVVGALAIILALGFDPFIQNLVKYETWYDVDPDYTAYIATTHTYTKVDEVSKIDMYAKYKFGQAIYDFGEDWKTPEYACASGNCTWTSFSTLGVCSHCADLTHKLTKSCFNGSEYFSTTPGAVGKPCDYSLPNGMHLDSDGEILMRLKMTDKPYIFKNYSNTLAILHSIASFDTVFVNTTTPVYASECVLVPCVKTISSSVGYYWFDQQYQEDPNADLYEPYNMDWYREEVLDVYEESHLVGDGFTSPQAAADPAYGVFLSPPKNDSRQIDGKSYHIGIDAFQAMKTYLSDSLEGYAYNSDGNTDYQNARIKDEPGYIDAIQAVHDQRDNRPICESSDEPELKGQTNVQCTMTNIALGFTTAMRDLEYNTLIGDLTPNMPNVTTGDVINPMTWVVVTWYWIALPIIVWALSVTMLLGTAWKTRKAGIRTWRTNPLALVFLGLGEEAAKDARVHDTSSEGLARKAASLKVRLMVTPEEALLEKTS